LSIEHEGVRDHEGWRGEIKESNNPGKDKGEKEDHKR